jgi:hypothetical protein
MRRSLSHSLMRPEAQPTPASTRIAAAGQFFAQAPHSMQASKSEIAACFFINVNT